MLMIRLNSKLLELENFQEKLKFDLVSTWSLSQIYLR